MFAQLCFLKVEKSSNVKVSSNISAWRVENSLKSTPKASKKLPPSKTYELIEN
jgi:hypothetical protein